MNGKTCLVTGATSGIGLATAKALAQQGATTVIVGRNHDKSRRICKKIKEETEYAEVEFMLSDLSSQQDIRHLAEEFCSRFKHLDVLINNAGARFVSRQTTVDGYEMTFALNHLAPFLLSRLLLDPLKAAGNARVINVSSAAHIGAVIDFDDIQNEKSYDGKRVYAQSKLENVLFTYELAKRLESCDITVNAMEPGNVLTHFCRNDGWSSWMRHIAGSLRSGNLTGPKKAAKTILYLASSPDVATVSGSYFSKKKPISSSPASYDEDSSRRLWKISEALTA